MSKTVILDVPYWSQLSEIEGSKEHIGLFKRRSCGIISLKMVLDFWYKKSDSNSSPSVKELVGLALKENSYSQKDGGWIHDGLVRVAQELGYAAWRRKWIHNKNEEKFFNSAGLNVKGWQELKNQTEKEGLSSIFQSLLYGIPVVVSISKNFNKGSLNSHLIVITGVDELKLEKLECNGFYFNDPYNPISSGQKQRKHRKNEFIDFKKFIDNWNKRAIFIIPKK